MATIWTAALSVPAPLIDHFITNHDAIFGDAADEASSAIIRVIDSGSPTSSTSGSGVDELRSPRKQMFTDLATPMPNQTSFGPNVHNSRAAQALDYGGMHASAQPGFRSIAAPQVYSLGGDHGYSSLNAALTSAAFSSPVATPPSPRAEEVSKAVKKGRRESSIRALGISSPIMSPGLAPPAQSSSLLSPGISAEQKRKSSMNRLREIAGIKEDG